MRFFGKVGYGENVETEPGIWTDIVVEYPYYGDVIRNTRRLEDDQKVNNDVSVSNSISIVADQYAFEHIFAIRYVTWQGSLWIVSTVEAQAPRLILRLGGRYVGPTAPVPG